MMPRQMFVAVGLAAALLAGCTPEDPELADVGPDPDAGVVPEAGIPPGGDLVLFLDPLGDDDDDGAAPETALLSLQVAHDRIEALEPSGAVTVEIAPGRYHLQQVEWTHFPPDGLTIRWAMPGERPIFDGCGPDDDPCPGGAFLRFEAAAGEMTDVDIEGLHIERYQRGVYFRGDREDPAGFNGGNRVADCVFSEIGNAYNISVGNAFGAVTLTNSRGNLVVGNRFERLLNFFEFGLLHGVYLAHYSDDNIVRDNVFDIVSGDGVRIRDASDRNLIEGNRFTKAGLYGVGEWYCEQDTRDDCTKAAPECPSFDNRVVDNVIDGTWPECEPLPAAFAEQDDVETGCALPAPGAMRFDEAGNTTPDASACEAGVDPVQRP